MEQAEQGITSNSYATIPRTLVFVLHNDELLLLRGNPRKARWANKLNGVGGHLLPDEDPWSAAQREAFEETGLWLDDLRLVALVHVADPSGGLGVMLFIFLAHTLSTEVSRSSEGELAWYPLAALPWAEMVGDLPYLLPRILAPENAGRIIYGLYTPDHEERLAFSFRCSS